MSRILVVDDARGTRDSFGKILQAAGHEMVSAASAEEALELVEATTPQVIVMDVQLPNMDGIEALRRLQARAARVPVIVMTGHSSTERAIQAMSIGAFEYFTKPFDAAEMLETIEDAIETRQLMDRAVDLNADASFPSGDVMIGASECMQRVYKAVGRVAATNATVLIRGETGTGKELVARAIYQHSLRGDRPLITLNCAAIPENLLESKLFGHEKGAFTGAHTRRLGKFEQADGATLFLDEIGEMPPSTQVKILRALENGEIERVGGSETIAVNVRLIAATNRDLEAAVRQGTFREDLYHRLNVIPIVLPPLRERRQDIPKLVNYFFVHFTQDHHLEPAALTPEAMQVLNAWDWPGNVRELQHCVNRALIQSGGYPITGEAIRAILEDRAPRSKPPAAAATDSDTATAPATLDDLADHFLRDRPDGEVHTDFMAAAESAVIQAALRATGGNKSQAAKLLGISRPSVQAKIKKYGITQSVRIGD